MSAIARLFVYGTLMPGEQRWPRLEPLTAPGAPEAATAAGRLYRTPYGWPSAVFGQDEDAVVPGVAVTLRDPGRALPVLDEIEGTGTGLFERRLIATTAGQCWAYHWPAGRPASSRSRAGPGPSRRPVPGAG